ncbi:MAG: hypothetical protein ACYTG0_16700 [Planctomycetota bacterium]
MSRVLEALRQVEAKSPDPSSHIQPVTPEDLTAFGLSPPVAVSEVESQPSDDPVDAVERPAFDAGHVEADVAPQDVREPEPARSDDAGEARVSEASGGTGVSPAPEASDEQRAESLAPSLSPELQPQHRSLADNVVKRLPFADGNVLMFAGLDPGRDNTAVLASLADALAERVKGEVLVVDADLASRATEVEALRRRSGIVLLNCPSVDAQNVSSWTRRCDGTYLMIRLGRTTRGAVRQAVRLTEKNGGRVLGCVLIDAPS